MRKNEHFLCHRESKDIGKSFSVVLKVSLPSIFLGGGADKRKCFTSNGQTCFKRDLGFKKKKKKRMAKKKKGLG